VFTARYELGVYIVYIKFSLKIFNQFNYQTQISPKISAVTSIRVQKYQNIEQGKWKVLINIYDSK
jgi:hypothetical protein